MFGMRNASVSILLTLIPASLPVLIPSARAAPISGETHTSVVCYLKTGNERTWQWGLHGDHSWYKLYGHWYRTEDTGITIFRTASSRDEIVSACINSKAYYNKDHYAIDGIYAADSSIGSNYPIEAAGSIINW